MKKHVLFIIDLLGKLCTPERDQEVAKLRTHLDDLVQLFKEIMKVLDHMKWDMVAEPGSTKYHQKPAPVSEKNKNQCSAIEIRNLTKDFSQQELIRVLKL